MRLNKIVPVLLLALIQTAAMHGKAHAAPAYYHEMGDTMIKEMSLVSDDSLFISTTFDSLEEITSFVDYFRKEYYNGNSPLAYKYQSRNDGSYRLLVEAPHSLATIADEHSNNTTFIKNVAQTLIGASEEETVNNVASYVQDLLFYDHDALSLILEEREKSVVGSVSRQYQAIGYSLNTGSSICYDYAVIAERILSAAGIKVAVAISTDNVHAYNLIRVNGQNYLYDLTAADVGYGIRALKISFNTDELETLQNITGVDYTIASIFPGDYFKEEERLG